MITINADTTGSILAAGRNITGVAVECELPVDFYATFGLGKYLFVDGLVVESAGWIAPVAALDKLKVGVA